MSPINTDPEEGTANGSSPKHEASAPPTPTAEDGTPVPAPTKVDAYKPRGYGSSNNHSTVGIVHLVLRFFTAVFSLISFAVIASDNLTLYTYDGFFVSSLKVHFHDFFFFSYLLTVTVLAFVYSVANLIFGVVLLTGGNGLNQLSYLLGIFAFDQIFSYLLMSAASSAATATRAEKETVELLTTFPSSFFTKAYASVAFGFLAFFALAATTLVSGYRVAHKGLNF